MSISIFLYLFRNNIRKFGTLILKFCEDSVVGNTHWCIGTRFTRVDDGLETKIICLVSTNFR